MSAATVLIVEDEPITALDEREIVEALGFEVVGVVKSGADAMAVAERTRPDVVLMDILLEGEFDGIEAARRLNEETSVPVVFVTAYGERQLVERALATAPYGYLLKPFSRESLATAIEVALQRQARENELQLALEDQRRNVDRLEREVGHLDHEWRQMVELLWNNVVTNEELQQALEDKTLFVSKVAHELRTSLNAISGFAQIMKHRVYGKLGDRRYREYAELLSDSTDDMLRLINNVLELSQVTMDGLGLEESDVDIEAAIEHAVTLMNGRATLRGITLAVDCSQPLPFLRGDQRRIGQILSNLLDNAISFTPKGGRVEVAARHEADGRLRLHVHDSGPGIPKHEMDRIRRRYGESEKERGLVHRGRGLGLPLARELMRLHAGTMSIDSSEGRGTSVTLAFPASRILPLGTGAT